MSKQTPRPSDQRREEASASEPSEPTAAGGRGRRSRVRHLPPVSVVPTLCTLGNLVAGFAAMHYSLKDPKTLLIVDWTPLEVAAILIFVGMLFDAIDGSIARLVQVQSDLGAQIDSLADMVTFGVAPAFLTLRLVSLETADGGLIIGPGADNVLGKIIWAAAAVYVCCAAMRLARYNLEAAAQDGPATKQFSGLPTPGAAGAVAGLIALHQHLLVTTFGDDVPHVFVRGAALGIPVVMLICAFVMVSSIPYVHVTNQFVRGQRTFAYATRLVVPLVLAIWFLEITLAVAFTAYALSGPVRVLFLRFRRQRRAEPKQPADAS